jgi:hypothetical protein
MAKQKPLFGMSKEKLKKVKDEESWKAKATSTAKRYAEIGYDQKDVMSALIKEMRLGNLKEANLKKKKKDYKLIREIKEIINNPGLHWWIKCKRLVKIKTYGRPGSWESEKIVRDFFKTCAGKYEDRFKSAYVRPYHEFWEDRDVSAKIGRSPRGMNIVKPADSYERFANYLKHKYPDAFEKFQEIKKVQRTYSSGMEDTNDYAWQHIFGRMRQYPNRGDNGWIKITKETQAKRRKLDLDMEKAQADYKELKKASKLPPRYL